MKLITATSATQGQRGNDFNFTVEGELVRLGIICSRDEQDPDGGCGCGRAWSGLNSQRATTTAVVREIDEFTLNDLAAAILAYLEQGGWADLFESPLEAENHAFDEAGELADIAARYPVGTVLERRLDDVLERCRV